MSLDADFDEIDRLCFDAFGVLAIYNNNQPCNVIVDRNVAKTNEYGEVVSVVTLLSLSKVEVSDPQQGDTVMTGDTTYTLRQFDSETDTETRWIVA